MQDVGLRYYTYYISMYYLMDACAANGKEVIILDRPNPNGFYVDGPVLQEEYKSNVGQLPIPIVYGMTWGEPDAEGKYWIDKLSGSDGLRKMVDEGKSAEEIKASWQSDINRFKEAGKPYLLYEE